MSIHEEATISAIAPMMGVFNNLDPVQPARKAEPAANSSSPSWPLSWAWNEDHTRLTFKLRQGVKWHDGKPFTAADVKCTWDMLTGKSPNKLRLNPRKAWYRNLDEVVDRRRLRGDLRPEAPAAGLSDAAGLGRFAGLPVPCAAGADAPPPDRHRPLQVRRIQAERTHQAGARTRITGSRAGPISTASSGRSCPTARPRASPLSPASST